jgi:hypothetical protein
VSYTTFPPYFQMENDTDPSTLNKKTLEHYYIRLFLDKFRQVSFSNCPVFKNRSKNKKYSNTEVFETEYTQAEGDLQRCKLPVGCLG